MLIIILIFACIEASMKEYSKIQHLKHSLPQLTESNQQYVLGIATGLKFVQGKFKEPPQAGKETIVKWRETKEV